MHPLWNVGLECPGWIPVVGGAGASSRGISGSPRDTDWNPSELPSLWNLIKDHKSLDAPSQGFGFGIPQNFQVFGL